jgi:hypothetical protein
MLFFLSCFAGKKSIKSCKLCFAQIAIVILGFKWQKVDWKKLNLKIFSFSILLPSLKSNKFLLRFIGEG